jgi:serine/threonine protein phosphatase 1
MAFPKISLRADRPSAPQGAKGHRAYVVGDIHGRLDLLEDLLAKVHADIQHRPTTKAVLAFVGDLIDRGPSSAQVIERLRTYNRSGVRPVFILGNHEEVLLRILEGDGSVISGWMRFGGLECLQSYGVDPASLRGRSSAELVDIARRAIPAAHAEFLRSFVDSCRFGDYLFVHAGIRPGVPIEQQRQADLRWIREPFLFDETDHGVVVVHGHTISRAVEERSNRIGIDTGAYRSGVLTALVIDGGERRLIDTAE